MPYQQPLTVSAMVALVAAETGGDGALFSRIARALINAGHLPKASGRAVPEVSYEGRARFLLACMATDRASDAVPEMLARYEALPLFQCSGPTAGEFLVSNLKSLAQLDEVAWLTWAYARIDVHRSAPQVTFAINARMRGMDPKNPHLEQLGYINQGWVSDGDGVQGFPVTASCMGTLLCALATGLPFRTARHLVPGVDMKLAKAWR